VCGTACRSAASNPLFRKCWGRFSGTGSANTCRWERLPALQQQQQIGQGSYASAAGCIVEQQWQAWQLQLLALLRALHPLLVQLGLSGPAGFNSTQSLAGAGAAAAAADGGASPSNADAGNTDSSSSSSSLNAAPMRWAHLLLQLQQCKGWVDAAAAFDSSCPDALGVIGTAHSLVLEHGDRHRNSSDTDGAGSSQQQPDISQLYADALQLCRALVAAAPLPLVCNNPGCDNLEGASEAAVASKMCAGCRCRYCSAACQAADWRRHRKGCKAMAAAGLVCS
jgi:hypothetical protein